MATTTPITAKVPAATAEAIADRASQMGISKSQLMSDAIAQYLGPIERPIEPTAVEPTPAPIGSTPPPTPSKPVVDMPAKITPDTRLTLEQLCDLFDIGFVDRGMDGVKITATGHTEICVNRGSAGALVARLTGWHCYPDATYGPYKPTAAEFAPNPNFVAVGQYAEEGAIIAAYRLEVKSPTDGHSPLSRVMAGARNQLTVPQAIAHLTGMAFSHDGTLVSPADKGSSFMIRLYQRLK
jgi:hypothetical protein